MKPRRILHVDGDAFFAGCEMALNPKLRNKPIYVGGGRNGDGIVIAANYEAKKFGIKTGMACFQARAICPRGVLVRPHYDEYRRISLEMFQILRNYTPTLLPTSIDEGFMDFTDMPRVFNCDNEKLVKRIKQEIWDKLGIKISAGLGSSRWLAKLATEQNKPDGFREVAVEEETAFVRDIPLEKLAGIAKRRARALRSFGAFTLGDVGQLPLGLIEKHFGFFGLELWLLSRGQLRETLEVEFKSRTTISSATTLPKDEPDYDNALLFLLDQAERISTTFFRENLKAREMSIYIRFNDFTDVGAAAKFTEQGLLVEGDVVAEPDTKGKFANQLRKVSRGASGTRVHPTGEFNPIRIARAVETLYWQLMRGQSKPVRQVIVGFYNFLPLDLQADLFGRHPEYKQRQLHHAMETIEAQHGRRKVMTGTRLLLEKQAPHLLGDRAKCPFAPQRELELKLGKVPLVSRDPTLEQEFDESPAEPSVNITDKVAQDETPSLLLSRKMNRCTSRAVKF